MDLGIGASSSEKNIIRMPVNTQHRTPNRFLQMLTNPPISLFVKTTDTNRTGTGATGKLVFVGGPTDKGCCSVETEEDERGFPCSIRLTFPDVCVALEGVSIMRQYRARLQRKKGDGRLGSR